MHYDCSMTKMCIYNINGFMVLDVGKKRVNNIDLERAVDVVFVKLKNIRYPLISIRIVIIYFLRVLLIQKI